MLPRQLRLPKNLFPIVKMKGNLVQGAFLAVIVLKNDGQVSRFGIIVSKKVSNLATRRNVVKRIIRNYIAANSVKIKEGYDIAILTKSSILNKDSESVGKDLDGVLTKLGLI